MSPMEGVEGKAILHCKLIKTQPHQRDTRIHYEPCGNGAQIAVASIVAIVEQTGPGGPIGVSVHGGSHPRFFSTGGAT